MGWTRVMPPDKAVRLGSGSVLTPLVTLKRDGDRVHICREVECYVLVGRVAGGKFCLVNYWFDEAVKHLIELVEYRGLPSESKAEEAVAPGFLSRESIRADWPRDGDKPVPLHVTEPAPTLPSFILCAKESDLPMDLAGAREMLAAEIAKWRQDQTYVPLLPFPVQLVEMP